MKGQNHEYSQNNHSMLHKSILQGVDDLGTVVKKRRKKIRKHKHRKMLKKTRHKRRKKS
jgi:hypothetical protein